MMFSGASGPLNGAAGFGWGVTSAVGVTAKVLGDDIAAVEA